MKLTSKLLITLGLTLTTMGTATADLQSVRQLIKENYPNFAIQVVGESPVKGIYELLIDGELIYTDESTKYFFVGNLVDFKRQVNLTEERKQELDRIDIRTLPLQQAIKYVKGNGQRKLYIFTDPDCPYCKQLEKELTKVDNITIYLFPYPIVSLHPKADIIAKKIWCSADQYQTWQNYLLKGKQPTGSTTCNNPIDKNIQLAKKLNISGTPTLFLENGERINGVASSKQLEKLFTKITP